MTTTTRQPAAGRNTNWTFYLWIGLALAVACAAVILGWHSGNGTTDPSDPTNALHMSRTTAVVNSGVLVFREGLETILVLAAITASLRGSNSNYRRPIAAGGVLAVAASIGTWFIAVGVLGIFHTSGLTLQAATGIPAIIVLLLVMNWFFHKVYWTGWISHHNKRRRSLLASGGSDANRRRLLFGLGLLGFSSVYREGFEIVLFLQNLRLTFGSSVVLEGVLLGALFTTATGVLTFALHAKLPYKKLLIITGVMLLAVLLVMVGEEINEMPLAGWIGTTSMGFTLPGWLGEWFSIFANWQTVIAQVLAVAFVLGSYLGAQYFRVWRPRRRGEQAARIAEHPPVQALGSTPLSV
jgi:high-affinity iron transporter